MELVFDIETTLIPDGGGLPDTVHCAVAIDPATGEVWRAVGDADLKAFVALLERADVLIGHNIAGFDVPVLKERFGMKTPVRMVDTFAVARAVTLTTAVDRSNRLRAIAAKGLRGDAAAKAMEERLPGRLVTRQSLEAWGYRLGVRKDAFGHTPESFDVFTPEMLAYCEQDVRVAVKLYRWLQDNGPMKGQPPMPRQRMIDESRLVYLHGKQERHGVAFDVEKAMKLSHELAGRREELAQALIAEFGWWYAPDGPHAGLRVPKRTTVSRTKQPGAAGYVNVEEGCELTKIKRVEFNPGSTQHIARVLKQRYGWTPQEHTNTGLPVVDEKTLAGLAYEPVKLIVEYLTIAKRLGQLAEGSQAWLKRVAADGRIHGQVVTTGTRTGRCSHRNPNLAQVPAVRSPYGQECRELFGPTRPDWVMVGADASGLELRLLGNRLAPFDGGEFAKIVVEADPHESWRKAAGLWTRDHQKTCTYAFIYGAGNGKLGQIVLADWRTAFEQGLTDRKPGPPRLARALGESVRARLLQNVPGLEDLLGECRRAFQIGYVVNAAGVVVPCKTEHGVLNDYLQSDGAWVMKLARLQFTHWANAELGPAEWAHLLDIHDEWQVQTAPENANRIGQLMVDAIRYTGRALGLAVELDGEYKVGANWAETH